MKRFVTLMIMALSFIGLRAQELPTVPSYPGGTDAMKSYIKENMHYPELAKENGIEGTVVVEFIVKADGSIGNIKIVRMVDPDLEAEAIRLVKGMPKWNPSKLNGKPMDAEVGVPIEFSLE